MAKFLITRKRMVTQQVTFEIEVNDGSAPIAAGEAVDAATLDWETVQDTALSTDVAPVAEPPSEATSEDAEIS